MCFELCSMGCDNYILSDHQRLVQSSNILHVRTQGENCCLSKPRKRSLYHNAQDLNFYYKTKTLVKYYHFHLVLKLNLCTQTVWIASRNACKTCAVVLYELKANLCIRKCKQIKTKLILCDSGKLQIQCLISMLLSGSFMSVRRSSDQ